MKSTSIIPRPIKLKVKEGTFTLTPETVILASAGGRAVGEYLSRLLAPATGVELAVKETGRLDERADSITLRINSGQGKLGPEGYTLIVLNDRVTIEATAPAGLFYGCQTLRQLMPAAIESRERIKGVAWTVPAVEIEDRPRYRWRGMHLDVARHFFPTVFIKRYIDLLALHKMNRFHWHLTDDQGWRIEIKGYPRLTEVGAWRKGEGGADYGGFYTQDEVREIVEYARQRFITVVPEIEMPGHAQAALAAYPELSCTGGPFEVWTEWGISREVFCAGNDGTFAVLEDVLSEVIDLFPGKYVHIGGDECPKYRWGACEKCQARIEAEGLKDEGELQSYFVKRISRFLAAQGRRLVGWDEVLEGGLAPDATVMSWRGIWGGITAARAEHDVVMSPFTHCYFDYKHADLPDEPGRLGVISLETVYSYDPTPAELALEEASHILGAQGNVWTEGMATERQVEQLAFPRMCALAEVVWSPPTLRDWPDFEGRLRAHGDRLEKLDVNFYRDPKVRRTLQVRRTSETRASSELERVASAPSQSPRG